MDIVIAYDIADTNTPQGAARLRRIADLCSSYGQRIQWSVFECRLSPTRYTQLLEDLHDHINPTADSVLIYRLPGTVHQHRTTIGIDKGHHLGTTWII